MRRNGTRENKECEEMEMVWWNGEMGFTDVHDTRLLGGPRMAGATQAYGGNKI